MSTAVATLCQHTTHISHFTFQSFWLTSTAVATSCQNTTRVSQLIFWKLWLMSTAVATPCQHTTHVSQFNFFFFWLMSTAVATPCQHTTHVSQFNFQHSWLTSTAVATPCQHTTRVSQFISKLFAINHKPIFGFHVSKLMLMHKPKTSSGFTCQIIQQRIYDHAADAASLLDIRPIVVTCTRFRTLDWSLLPGISIPVAIPSRTIVPPCLRNSPLTITALRPLVMPPIVIIVPTFSSPVGPILWNFIQFAFLSFSFATFRAFSFGTFLVPRVRFYNSLTFSILRAIETDMSCFPTSKASDLTDVRVAWTCSVLSAPALPASAFYRVNAELIKGMVLCNIPLQRVHFLIVTCCLEITEQALLLFPPHRSVPVRLIVVCAAVVENIILHCFRQAFQQNN